MTAGGGFGPSVGNRFSLDEKHGYVYLTSNKDNATERQLYHVSLADKSVAPITKAVGTHSVLLAPDSISLKQKTRHPGRLARSGPKNPFFPPLACGSPRSRRFAKTPATTRASAAILYSFGQFQDTSLVVSNDGQPFRLS